MRTRKKVSNKESKVRLGTKLLAITTSIIVLIILPLLLYVVQDGFKDFVNERILGLSSPVKYRTSVKVSSPFNWVSSRKDLSNSGNSSDIFEYPLDYSWKPIALTSPTHTQPIADLGFIYISTLYGLRLYKIDARNGEVVWQFEDKTYGQDNPISVFPLEETIAVDGEYIISHTPLGLSAYKTTESNREVWQFIAGDISSEYPMVRHPLTCPKIIDSSVYFTHNFYIYKLNRFNGNLLDSIRLDGEVMSTPAIDVIGNRLYVLMQYYKEETDYVNDTIKGSAFFMYKMVEMLLLNNKINGFNKFIDFNRVEMLALDLDSLNPIWQKKIDGDWTLSSSPVVSNHNEIILVGMDDALFAYDLNSGEVRWTVAFPGGVTTPSIKNKVVICIHHRKNEVVSLNIDNGKLNWKKTIPNIVNGFSPTLSNRNVFVAGDSLVYSLDISSGDIVWTSPVISKIQTPPSIAFGQLLFLAFDHNESGPFLYSFSNKTVNE